MKTYIVNSIKKIRFYKENLDVKLYICDKPWQVFNDSGEKELYIFLSDGTLVISRKGDVTNAKWKYINANKSIIITTSNGSVMVHPAYNDDLVFALQKDGTDEYAILINEKSIDKFHPQNIMEIDRYFENKLPYNNEETTLAEETDNYSYIEKKDENIEKRKEFDDNQSVMIWLFVFTFILLLYAIFSS